MDTLPTPTKLFVTRGHAPWSALTALVRPLPQTHAGMFPREARAARRHVRRALVLLLCVAALLLGMGMQSLYTADLAERLTQAQTRRILVSKLIPSRPTSMARWSMVPMPRELRHSEHSAGVDLSQVPAISCLSTRTASRTTMAAAWQRTTSSFSPVTSGRMRTWD